MAESPIEDIKFSTAGPRTTHLEEVYGTPYPYFNVKKDFLNNFLGSVRRAIAPINPFSLRQIPSEDRMAFTFRNGNQFYQPTPYPNHIRFSRLLPGHYDPLAQNEHPKAGFNRHSDSIGTHASLAMSYDAIPRGCARARNAYKRCVFINGESKCEEEGNDFLAVCPAFVLDGLKELKAQKLKQRGLDAFYYAVAMEVSPYNKGRTIKDVPKNTKWSDGERQNLRPDTLYADDRYANITQEEINAAKVRNAEREAVRRHQTHDHGHHDDHGHGHHSRPWHHYDKKEAEVKAPQEPPRYP
jgi:hypothetical protein